jgi:hypothetical protein
VVRSGLSLRVICRLNKRKASCIERPDAPYTPGRSNTGRNQLKHKSYATHLGIEITLVAI